MRLTTFPIIIAGLLGLVSSIGAVKAFGAKALPPSPQYYVLDEVGVLTPVGKRTVESLLVEHDHLTGQQIMVGVFKDSGDAKSSEWTRQIFQEWKIGKRGRDEGVLFALYLDTKSSYIEVGYGLESQLPDAEIQKIIGDFVDPDLRKGLVAHGLASGVFHLLEVLNSPLIQSGKAMELLSEAGIRDLTRDFSQVSSEWLDHSRPWKGWPIFVVLGLVMTAGLLIQLLSREAHFTSSGWFRPYPWEMLLKKRAKKSLRLGRSPLNSDKKVHVSPIITAIQEAEKDSLTTMRVHVSKNPFEKHPEKKAKKLFTHYEVDRSNPNSVLIYINLYQLSFATVAGSGFDSLGPSFWKNFGFELERSLRSTQSEKAIALSVKSLGEALKKHFPTGS